MHSTRSLSRQSIARHAANRQDGGAASSVLIGKVGTRCRASGRNVALPLDSFYGISNYDTAEPQRRFPDSRASWARERSGCALSN